MAKSSLVVQSAATVLLLASAALGQGARFLDAPIPNGGELKNPKLASHLTHLAAVEKAARASGKALRLPDVSGLPEDLRALVLAAFGDGGILAIRNGVLSFSGF